MFNQVLKQLWNARRSNAWIWAVLLVVSVLLWFEIGRASCRERV